jgi:glycosyltransferase involved in cell wall biosynthesis
MKKLLFDLIATQPSPMARFHGGAQYAKTIFLMAVDRGITQFDCIYDHNLELSEDIRFACAEHNIKCISINQLSEVQEVILQGGYDAFYSSLPYEYINLSIGKTIFIMDVLGLRELEMPTDKYEITYRDSLLSKIKLIIRKLFFEKRTLDKNKKKYIDLLKIKHKHILTISNHSKYSLLNFFPFLRPDEITVNYAPIDFSDFTPQPNNKGDYFLLVSANRWIKNNIRAILALDQLFSEAKLKDKKVVVLGLPNDHLVKLKNRSKFVFKDYVEINELKDFYRHAYCFIYPSLNEGFGYPPLDAMKYGTPVLASAISAIPEVCNNAALYFNPFSIAEIRNRILQIDDDQQLYSKLQHLGVNRLEELKANQECMVNNLLKIIFS